MPRKVDHEARREAFAEAAFRVIQKRGLAGATVREVAREAGFTTGALVHYVKSKDELLLAAAATSTKLLRREMMSKERNLHGVDALREVMFLSLPLDKAKRGAWNVWIGFWERSTQNSEVRALTRKRYLEWNTRLVRIIETAQQEGELPTDVNATRAAQGAVALIDGIGVQVMLAGRKMAAAVQLQLVEDWISSTFRLILQPAATTARLPEHSSQAKPISESVR